ncbi:hypothetical protein C8Q73DRAFT_708184 [Cubamyces lactineus]|nr:hypothetical protein C8Q73DRAFT_708184 [Cubamyces lactineus]
MMASKCSSSVPSLLIVEKISRRSTITLDSVRMNKELIDLKVFRSKRPTINELLIVLMRAEERLQAANAALSTALQAYDVASVEVQSLQARCATLEEMRNSCRTELDFARDVLDGPVGSGEDEPMDVDPPEVPEARPGTPPPQPSSVSGPQPFQRGPTLPDLTTGPPVTPVRNLTIWAHSDHGLPTPPTTDEQPRRRLPVRHLQSLSYASIHVQAGATSTAGTSASAPDEQQPPVPDVPASPQTPSPNFLATPPPTAPRITIGDCRRMMEICEAQQDEEDRQRDARESQLRGEIAARGKEVAELRTTLKRCRTEIVDLKKQAQEYQEREKGYKKREEDHKKREAELVGKIKILKEGLSSHKDILGRNKDQIAQLGRELEQCKAQNAALTAQLKSTEQALKKAQDEHAHLRDSITQFSGGLHQLLSQHEDLLQPGNAPACGDSDSDGEPAEPSQ